MAMTIAAKVLDTEGRWRPNCAPLISELLNNLKRLIEACRGLCFEFNGTRAPEYVRPQLQSDIYERRRDRLSPDLGPYEENKIRERAKLVKEQRGSEQRVNDGRAEDDFNPEELDK
ncbi:MAG: hypothetical protein NZO16_07285 [Deltaproteobacteria bacterium]|nr:hypothetical protein [Deltaproteobacteria bacterium]